MSRLHASLLTLLLGTLLATPAPTGAQGEVQQFDFQPDTGRLEPGFTAVMPENAYSPDTGYGFTVAPDSGVNGARHSWNIFGRRVRVGQGIPASVLSDATLDAVVHTRPFTFRTDVPPGEYDVTVWLGDVTKPQFLVRATVNGVNVDVDRLDVIIFRGRFDVATLPDGRTPGIGNAVPRTVRVDASDGFIEVTVGPGEDRGPDHLGLHAGRMPDRQSTGAADDGHRARVHRRRAPGPHAAPGGQSTTRAQ